MVKAVTWYFAAFSNILIDIFVPNLPQSPDTGQNPVGGISDIRISGQSFINENCHNFRTSHDTDIKLGPVTKLDKKNAATATKIDDDVMSANCHVIVFFPIYGQFADIRKPEISFLIKVQASGLKLYKKGSTKQVFSCEVCEIFTLI